jgi:type II secretory ATPase GspE/PulE/Tfp pilus assembly ATPase PilB-like protein
MEMDRLNFADAMIGIIAQRLVRRLCEHCSKEIRPRRAAYDQLIADFKRDCPQLPDAIPPFDKAVLKVKHGCEQCDNTGYRGRIAIHEVMVGSPKIKAAIRKGCGGEELRQLALAEGMWTLRMDGIMKIFSGVTDLEQIHKVCI